MQHYLIRKWNELNHNHFRRRMTTTTIRTFICWQHFTFQPLYIYPTVPLNGHNNPTLCPTLEEFTCACHTMGSTFILLHSGRCVITNPKKTQVNHCCVRVHSLGAVDHEVKGQLELLIHFSTRLKRVYQSGGLVSSWGGNMRAIGQRKDQEFHQTMGSDITANILNNPVMPEN
ncbi:hypothetical protein VP01_3740g1 [Puccinia sorghi]|uniref:Uncharacterized protein n=1 Tax=Puccinia sorghi TaxID=27349 RepID=A0A0L6UTW9_9BASI|nr:hypothetical protein VP01_3740g1 [Puccinia sorghi]